MSSLLHTGLSHLTYIKRKEGIVEEGGRGGERKEKSPKSSLYQVFQDFHRRLARFHTIPRYLLSRCY